MIVSAFVFTHRKHGSIHEFEWFICCKNLLQHPKTYLSNTMTQHEKRIVFWKSRKIPPMIYLKKLV
ncbi:hypothetical protein A2501_01990 [Candidatus Uhrbacteria bacterium RIFOXYC12_FULL_57_11]|nr:MAG: hypothetical protein A2501_01990 [Candidatus Uhrbacteria bacterium RIFOXYC12_FULL_57_11]